MNERVLVYTEEGELIGTVDKKNYERLPNKIKFKGKDVEPWLKCVTCFLIDKNDKKVAVESRGLDEIDPGELDLCSGHISEGESPIQTMVREAQEEMTMKGYTPIEIEKNLIFCGNVKMDFTKGKINKGKNLRCDASVYAILLDGKDCIETNTSAVARIAWMDFEKVKQKIRNAEFRFPYTEQTAESYEQAFGRIDRVLKRQKEISGSYEK